MRQSGVIEGCDEDQMRHSGDTVTKARCVTFILDLNKKKLEANQKSVTSQMYK